MELTKRIIGLGVILAMSVFLAGCGETETNSHPTCTESFMADYNAIVQGSRDMRTRDGLRALRSQAEQFQTKYPGMVCEKILTEQEKQLGTLPTVDVDVWTTRLIRAVDRQIGILESQQAPQPPQ